MYPLTFFLILVQFWSGPVPNEFSIHGLWPEFFNDSYPAYCNRSAIFNLSEISDLLPYMNKVWSSQNPMDNEAFWEHEYLKHGTCVITQNSSVPEHFYFQQALSWYNDSASNTVWQKNQLKIGQNYDRDHLNDLFQGSFQCTSQDYISGYISSCITELWRCYGVSKCPVWITEQSCPNNIIFCGTISS